MSEQHTRRVQRLMNINMELEVPPELVSRLANDSILLDNMTKSDQEMLDMMFSEEEQEENSLALLYYILTSGENPKLFEVIVSYINGGGDEYWPTVLYNMNRILFECWSFIHPVCKKQLLRLIREAVRQNVKQVENVLMNAYRMAIGSFDFKTKREIFRELEEIIYENNEWFLSLKGCAALVANILTCTTYVIVSSPAPMKKQDTFCESMIHLVYWVIKNRKSDCLALGRDFILILIRLGKLPKIEEIWKDLATNPTTYGVTSIEEYMGKPNLLQHLRVSIELDRKLQFMVHNGGNNLLTSFESLSQHFFHGTDGPALRAECVRHILYMSLDPTKVQPIVLENRIQLLHLLITTAPSGAEQQWLKLCLFADWFGCDERNLTNFNYVEVPLAVVRYALFLSPSTPHPNAIVQSSHCSYFANALLEYVCKSVDVILPVYAESIRRNVNSAMRYCKDRLQHDLSQILENSKIDRKVADLIRGVWPEFVRNNGNSMGIARPKKKPIEDSKLPKTAIAATSSSPESLEKSEKAAPPTEKASTNSHKSSSVDKEKLQKVKEEKEEQELKTSIKLLRGEVGAKVETMKREWKEFDDDADKCEAVEALLLLMLKTEENFDKAQQKISAQCLQGIIGSVVTDKKSLLPENEKDLTEAFTHPIYSFLKMLCKPPDDDDSSSDIMTTMMAEMCKKDASLTYVLLYFIKGTAGYWLKECLECYKDIAKMSGRGVDEMLASDLQLCAVNDNRLFAFLVPFVFAHFEEEVMSSPELLSTLCANLDANQLKTLIDGKIRTGKKFLETYWICFKNYVGDVFLTIRAVSNKSLHRLWKEQRDYFRDIGIAPATLELNNGNIDIRQTLSNLFKSDETKEIIVSRRVFEEEIELVQFGSAMAIRGCVFGASDAQRIQVSDDFGIRFFVDAPGNLKLWNFKYFISLEFEEFGMDDYDFYTKKRILLDWSLKLSEIWDWDNEEVKELIFLTRDEVSDDDGTGESDSEENEENEKIENDVDSRKGPPPENVFEETTFQPSETTFKVAAELFIENRQRLVESIKTKVPRNSAILLRGGVETNRYNTDAADLPFRQEPYFFWAFGVNESEFHGIIDLTTGKTTLFAPRLDPSYAIWDGKINDEKYFKEKYAVDEVIFNDKPETIAEKLKALAAKQVYLLHAENTDSDNVLVEPKFAGSQEFQLDTKLLYKEMAELRVIKSEKEIDVMRYASKIASEAHRAAMKHMKPGLYENHLESFFSHISYYHGGCLQYGHANAPNDKFIKDGDMCLFDMGSEYNCYASDITTSFPSNGKFTEKQKIVYNAVLDANIAVLKAAKPGVSWVDMHLLSEKVILEHLKKAGLVVGDIDKAVEARVGAVFMPHGLGHLIGLDVYDCGGYMGDATPRSTLPGLNILETTRTLKERMAITIGPGCYFIDVLLDKALADSVKSAFLVKAEVDKYRGSGGVRIEDDVIIRASGNENLSDLPRTIEEIENFMASGGQWTEKVIESRVYELQDVGIGG